ncbi:MAG: calcium/sodium antiporter [Lachnospira sp.]|nr:calcium/sodium antiporter [Lachnospira sp.]
MTILLNLVLLLAGFVLLIKGADYFVDGSSAVAQKFKIPGVVIGLTIVAMGTSAPELAVSISAALTGSNEIAISNVMGSNIFNLVLIFGICAVIAPVSVDRNIMKRDFPFSAGLSVLLAVLISDIVISGREVISESGKQVSGSISRIDAMILIVIFVAYIVFTVVLALKNRTQEEKKADLSSIKCVIYILGGIAAIVIGGQLVVNSAKQIAYAFNMTETLVGLTIVAVGTSLPELVTSAVASRKGQSGIAAGNIIGSNVFNILFILGVSAFIHPITVLTESLYDCIVLIAFNIIVYIFAATGKKLDRKEGAVMIGVYVLYMIYAVCRGMGWLA